MGSVLKRAAAAAACAVAMVSMGVGAAQAARLRETESASLSLVRCLGSPSALTPGRTMSTTRSAIPTRGYSRSGR